MGGEIEDLQGIEQAKAPSPVDVRPAQESGVEIRVGMSDTQVDMGQEVCRSDIRICNPAHRLTGLDLSSGLDAGKGMEVGQNENQVVCGLDDDR